MIQDIINGGFEFAAGLAVLRHCAVLQRDRQVRGVSIPAMFFFTAWGFWNIYYYPFLGQPFSFVGGIFVTVANCGYLALLMQYRAGAPQGGFLRGVTITQVCIFVGKWRAGYRPGEPGWAIEDQRILDAIHHVKWAVCDFLCGLVCFIRGHNYPFYVIRPNSLYFCTRCHREMFGRTIDDIKPMSNEELEDFRREIELEWERGHP